MKINLAVFFGGMSVEHEISVISAQQAMAAADTDKYNILPVYITKKGEMYHSAAMTNIDVFKDIPTLLTKSRQVTFINSGGKVHMIGFPSKLFEKSLSAIDIALPVIHGTNAEDGTLQGFFELLSLPYAGCNILASSAGMDKVVMKQILQAHNIPVLPCQYFYMRDFALDQQAILEKAEALGYPLIVKPANLGSSVGIKKAADRDELLDAIELAGSFAPKILIESAITNLREINCSVLGDVYDMKTSICEEPIAGDIILSYQDKYMSGSKGSKGGKNAGMSGAARKIPADLDDVMEKSIRQICADTFKALGCSGVARVDCMIDTATGSFYVNEINTIPGSLSFYLWEKTGISFPALIDELVSIALKQKREKDAITFTYDTNILSLQSGGAKGAKGVK